MKQEEPPWESPAGCGLWSTSSIGMIPVQNARITISYKGVPDVTVVQLDTDNSGQTETIDLPSPPIDYSMEPGRLEQPYSEYNVRVEAEGYEPVEVSGTEILPEVTAWQNVEMNPSETSEEDNEIIVIPDHTLYGEYPPKIEEDEIKPVEEGEIVLSRVVIPEYIVVHDGVPDDSTARNYYVHYRDYIKNVASSEIYATWPESTIYANVLAIMSFTLNRVYTEWYRNKGIQFYDHIFHSIRSEMDLRTQYLFQYQSDCGHDFCKLSVKAGGAAANLYLLLRRAAYDLQRLEPVGLQVSWRSGVHAD